MSGALLAVSLLLNALFLGVVLLFWLQRIRIFHQVIHDIDTHAAVTFFEAYPVAPGDIVFLGDSITAGGHWVEMFPDMPARNRGISGDRTGDILERLTQITSGRPAKVFLLIGTNDIGLGVPREETLQNYAAILRRLAEASPDTRVYVQSVLPREPKAADDVRQLNGRIKEMAQGHGMPYLDLFAAFVDENGGIQEPLSYDGLHLSGEGYRLWESLLEPYVGEDVAVVHPAQRG
jgi:lysophospholipase L1-like esterase